MTRTRYFEILLKYAAGGWHRNELKECYVDYREDFLSLSNFAKYYQITTDLAETVISKGQEIYNQGE